MLHNSCCDCVPFAHGISFRNNVEINKIIAEHDLNYYNKITVATGCITSVRLVADVLFATMSAIIVGHVPATTALCCG